MKEKLFPLMSLLLIVGIIGCSGVKNSMRLSEKSSAWNPLHHLSKERKEDQDENAKPVTMSAIWADSVYEKPGVPRVKGFGGRFFFYDENNTAVKADGELIVYGFDESVKDKSESIADRKFIFPRDKFQTHYSENDLGAAYSVWIPWEKMGGYRKSITLIPMFKTADGRLIKCSQAICTLPGKEIEGDQLDFANEKQAYKVLGSSPAVVSQAGYQSGTPLQTSAKKVAKTDYQDEIPSINRVKTSTILMNPSMARRVAQAGPQRNRNNAATTERRPAENSSAAADSTTVSNDELVAPSGTSETNPMPQRSVAQQTPAPQERPAFGQPAPWTR